MIHPGGSVAPVTRAILTLMRPATQPLSAAMNIASEAETLRVRLLSIAHDAQASAMRSGPAPPLIPTGPAGHESTTPPATISTMPNTMRRSAFSRKTTHAITAVSTASRFNNREAVAAAVWARPNMSSNGPSTPPRAIAPSSQGHSRIRISAGRHPRSRIRRAAVRPRPLPR